MRRPEMMALMAKELREFASAADGNPPSVRITAKTLLQYAGSIEAAGGYKEIAVDPPPHMERVLLWDPRPGNECCGHYDRSLGMAFGDLEDFEPTHWAPLPKHPPGAAIPYWVDASITDEKNNSFSFCLPNKQFISDQMRQDIVMGGDRREAARAALENIGARLFVRDSRESATAAVAAKVIVR